MAYTDGLECVGLAESAEFIVEPSEVERVAEILGDIEYHSGLFCVIAVAVYPSQIDPFFAEVNS